MIVDIISDIVVIVDNIYVIIFIILLNIEVIWFCDDFKYFNFLIFFLIWGVYFLLVVFKYIILGFNVLLLFK